MALQRARAIVNPAAGGHASRREWPGISKRLTARGLILDHVYTEGTGHAIDLARAAANTDCRYIIAVGGDGTVNEVVNGILSSNSPHDVTLGIVSAGTTCSFARSVGIASGLVSSCQRLTSQNRLLIDVGIVECRSQGQVIYRYFVNEADVGFGAAVVEASKTMPTYFGRKINYLPHLLGGFGSLLSYKNKQIALRIDDEAEVISVCSMVVIANGTHFGGGMCIAPDARPDDGLLDMVIFGDMGKPELVKIWPMTYKGRHISHRKVRLRQIKKLAIRCDEKVLVEADGGR